MSDYSEISRQQGNKTQQQNKPCKATNDEIKYISKLDQTLSLLSACEAS